MNFQVIEAKRKKERLTVKELCENAEIDRTTYYKMKKNPDSMRVSTFRKIADALNMTDEEKMDSLA